MPKVIDPNKSHCPKCEKRFTLSDFEPFECDHCGTIFRKSMESKEGKLIDSSNYGKISFSHILDFFFLISGFVYAFLKFDKHYNFEVLELYLGILVIISGLRFGFIRFYQAIRHGYVSQRSIVEPYVYREDNPRDFYMWLGFYIIQGLAVLGVVAYIEFIKI